MRLHDGHSLMLIGRLFILAQRSFPSSRSRASSFSISPLILHSWAFRSSSFVISIARNVWFIGIDAHEVTIVALRFGHCRPLGTTLQASGICLLLDHFGKFVDFCARASEVFVTFTGQAGTLLS